MTLTSYPAPSASSSSPAWARQPTVIITNDRQITTRALIERYARRMTIEQRLAEIIQAFAPSPVQRRQPQRRPHVVLCVLAQALTAAFRLRLPGNYAHATPDTLQRRFLDTPGEIISDGTSITVKINRRATARTPRRRHASRHHRPLVGRTPHFESPTGRSTGGKR